MIKTLTPEKLIDIFGDPGQNPANIQGKTILKLLDDIRLTTDGTNSKIYNPGDAVTLSTTPLAANATFVTDAIDGQASRLGNVGIIAYSDVDGTMSIEGSIDGTNWDVVLGTQALTGGTGNKLIVQVPCRYIRAKYVNGAADQTVFRFGGRYFI